MGAVSQALYNVHPLCSPLGTGCRKSTHQSEGFAHRRPSAQGDSGMRGAGTWRGSLGRRPLG